VVSKRQKKRHYGRPTVGTDASVPVLDRGLLEELSGCFMGTRQTARIPPDDLKRFAAAIRQNREQLLKDWSDAVRSLPAAQPLDTPTLTDLIPSLLDRLADALAHGHTESILTLQLEDSPQLHGSQRLRAGFDIVEVVAEYNILRELLHSVAERQGIEI